MAPVKPGYRKCQQFVCRPVGRELSRVLRERLRGSSDGYREKARVGCRPPEPSPHLSSSEAPVHRRRRRSRRLAQTKKRTCPWEEQALFVVCRQCRREDLNLHGVNPHQVLNLARLPIPPLRLSFVFRTRGPVLQAPRPASFPRSGRPARQNSPDARGRLKPGLQRSVALASLPARALIFTFVILLFLVRYSAVLRRVPGSGGWNAFRRQGCHRYDCRNGSGSVALECELRGNAACLPSPPSGRVPHSVR